MMNRRSGAVFLLPMLGVLVFVVLSFRDRTWGQWLWAVDLMTGVTVLTGPVLAACAAHLQWTQAQLDDLVDTTPRAGWVPLRCAFQAWRVGLVGYGVSGVVIVVLTWLRPHGGPFPLWVAAIGLPVLGVCALFGALAVRLLPHRLTVLGVAPSVFLAGAFGPSPYADLLRQGPSTGSLAGLAFDPTVWVLQFAGLMAVVGVLVGGTIIAARRSRGCSRLPLAAAVVALSLGALVACGTALDDPERRRLVVSAERPTVCRGSAPTICVAPSSVYALMATDHSIRRALRRLDLIGVKVPDRYEEEIPSYRPPQTVGRLVVDFDAGSLRAGARNAVTPAACPQWTDPRAAPEKALMARELIGLWVRASEGEKVSSWTQKGDAWLARPSAPAAEAWVRTTYAQLMSCEFAKIRMPWTPPKRR